MMKKITHHLKHQETPKKERKGLCRNIPQSYLSLGNGTTDDYSPSALYFPVFKTLSVSSMYCMLKIVGEGSFSLQS